MSDPLSDEQLMIRLQEGDTAALEAIYYRYADRLMGFLYRMVDGDRARADDLLQDVFVRLATSASAFDPTRSFRPWIFTIAANLARNTQRNHTLRVAHHDNLPEFEEVYTKTDISIDQLDHDLFRSLLDQSLRVVAPDKRIAFLLRYQEHLSLAEIAEIQDCAIGTIKSRIFYTLRFLESSMTTFRPEKQSS
ncbi:MAG: sigma-70 family RNA polymerase sigma factor [Saprospiraceae bacterium]|nr:sigma-70 family RNA polymerase sigma factor [Saprospiraceae bacterium]